MIFILIRGIYLVHSVQQAIIGFLQISITPIYVLGYLRSHPSESSSLGHHSGMAEVFGTSKITDLEENVRVC